MPLRGGDDIRSVNAYPLLKITQVMMGGRHPGRLRLLSIEPPALWERWRGDELIASSPGPIAVRDASTTALQSIGFKERHLALGDV